MTKRNKEVGTIHPLRNFVVGPKKKSEIDKNTHTHTMKFEQFLIPISIVVAAFWLSQTVKSMNLAAEEDKHKIGGR